jgi:hypothetical protein
MNKLGLEKVKPSREDLLEVMGVHLREVRTLNPTEAIVAATNATAA